MYKESVVSVKMTCDPSAKASKNDMSVNVGWIVRRSPCFEEYTEPDVTVSPAVTPTDYS